jgi:hypothetical protein
MRGRKAGNYLRKFNPNESAEVLVSGQPDGGVYIQGGCYYTEDKQFVRVSESRRHLYEAWLSTQTIAEPEAEAPVEEVKVVRPAKPKSQTAEYQRVRSRFIKAYGKPEWDALPEGAKIKRAKEILG